MDYSLRRPCKKCPFRSDVSPYLGADRAREIGESVGMYDRTKLDMDAPVCGSLQELVEKHRSG